MWNSTRRAAFSRDTTVATRAASNTGIVCATNASITVSNLVPGANWLAVAAVDDVLALTAQDRIVPVTPVDRVLAVAGPFRLVPSSLVNQRSDPVLGLTGLIARDIVNGDAGAAIVRIRITLNDVLFVYG